MEGNMTRVVVVGARGFVGAAVAAEARARGLEVVERRADDAASSGEHDAVLYVSGVAFGANANPREAYRLHVVEAARWASAPHATFTYASSTRVYGDAPLAREDAPLAVVPGAGDAYVGSKIAGETTVLGGSPRARVVRYSNVVGPSTRSGLFLSDVLRQAAEDGVVRLQTALDSSKDYLDVRDAAAWTLDVALSGRERTYNLGAGRNTTHGAIADELRRIANVEVVVPPDAPTVVVAPIDVARVTAEFPRSPRDPLAELPGYFAAFAAARASAR
jgi:2'-hydroxyisoflavone reductase